MSLTWYTRGGGGGGGSSPIIYNIVENAHENPSINSVYALLGKYEVVFDMIPN